MKASALGKHFLASHAKEEATAYVSLSYTPKYPTQATRGRSAETRGYDCVSVLECRRKHNALRVRGMEEARFSSGGESRVHA